MSGPLDSEERDWFGNRSVLGGGGVCSVDQPWCGAGYSGGGKDKKRKRQTGRESGGRTRRLAPCLARRFRRQGRAGVCSQRTRGIKPRMVSPHRVTVRCFCLQQHSSTWATRGRRASTSISRKHVLRLFHTSNGSLFATPRDTRYMLIHFMCLPTRRWSTDCSTALLPREQGPQQTNEANANPRPDEDERDKLTIGIGVVVEKVSSSSAEISTITTAVWPT